MRTNLLEGMLCLVCVATAGCGEEGSAFDPTPAAGAWKVVQVQSWTCDHRSAEADQPTIDRWLNQTFTLAFEGENAVFSTEQMTWHFTGPSKRPLDWEWELPRGDGATLDSLAVGSNVPLVASEPVGPYLILGLSPTTCTGPGTELKFGRSSAP
jgi:hypothetical protein